VELQARVQGRLGTSGLGGVLACHAAATVGWSVEK
jgi:hypothetical protein